jgi:biopolymer transport protein ExbB
MPQAALRPIFTDVGSRFPLRNRSVFRRSFATPGAPMPTFRLPFVVRPNPRPVRIFLAMLPLLAVGVALSAGVAWGQETAAAEAPHQTKSTLMWFIESSGWIGAIILILSMYFVATVGKLFYEMRLDRELPTETLAEAKNLVEQQDFRGAYDRLREDPSMFGRVASAGMAELNNGIDESRTVMEHVGEAETVEMERRISMLAVLGTLGPMIGLLGTLKGMIASFSVIALSDVQLKASEVAGGISEALLLTFEGVALSVPAIYFYAVFRNRVSSISTTVLLESEELVRRIATIGRNMRSAAQATPARAR